MQAKPWKHFGLLLAAGLVIAPLAACGSDDSSDPSTTPSSSDTTDTGAPQVGGTLHLGYFPNLTHAPAIVGVEKGYFKDALAENGADLKTQIFDSGSDTLEALAGGSLDATFIGPSPAITAFAQSHGELVRLISGATGGGASLMVNDSITSVDQLKGKTLATPGAANTQDVALKYFLKTKGFDENPDGTGDVSIINQDNGTTVQAFAQGDIDGAWVPEPYASQLEAEGATRLINEATLWPKGQFVTTVLIVRTDFLNDNPVLVDDLLKGEIQAVDYIDSDSAGAEKVVGDWLADYSQKAIPQDVLDTAWANLTFTLDPIANSLIDNEQHAVDAGLLDPVDNLDSIFDLDPLNALLTAANKPTVSGPTTP